MSERQKYVFRRYVNCAERAEGVAVHAETLDDAIQKAEQIVYADERPVTILVLTNAADRIADLEGARDAIERVRGCQRYAPVCLYTDEGYPIAEMIEGTGPYVLTADVLAALEKPPEADCYQRRGTNEISE